jgi:hypothetical protein
MNTSVEVPELELYSNINSRESEHELKFCQPSYRPPDFVDISL